MPVTTRPTELISKAASWGLPPIRSLSTTTSRQAGGECHRWGLRGLTRPRFRPRELWMGIGPFRRAAVTDRRRKSKPIARSGRKAMGLRKEYARPPKPMVPPSRAMVKGERLGAREIYYGARSEKVKWWARSVGHSRQWYRTLSNGLPAGVTYINKQDSP